MANMRVTLSDADIEDWIWSRLEGLQTWEIKSLKKTKKGMIVELIDNPLGL